MPNQQNQYRRRRGGRKHRRQSGNKSNENTSEKTTAKKKDVRRPSSNAPSASILLLSRVPQWPRIWDFYKVSGRTIVSARRPCDEKVPISQFFLCSLDCQEEISRFKVDMKAMPSATWFIHKAPQQVGINSKGNLAPCSNQMPLWRRERAPPNPTQEEKQVNSVEEKTTKAMEAVNCKRNLTQNLNLILPRRRGRVPLSPIQEEKEEDDAQEAKTRKAVEGKVAEKRVEKPAEKPSAWKEPVKLPFQEPFSLFSANPKPSISITIKEDKSAKPKKQKEKENYLASLPPNNVPCPFGPIARPVKPKPTPSDVPKP